MKAKLSSFEPSDREVMKKELVSSSSSSSSSSCILIDIDTIKSSELSKAWLFTCKTIAKAFILEHEHHHHHPLPAIHHNHPYINSDGTHSEDELSSNNNNKSTAALQLILRSYFLTSHNR